MPGLYGASDRMTREAEQWSTEKVEDSFLWRCVDASLGLGRAAIVNLVRSWKCTRQFHWIINAPSREYVCRAFAK